MATYRASLLPIKDGDGPVADILKTGVSYQAVTIIGKIQIK
jgi:hypothetical protein